MAENFGRSLEGQGGPQGAVKYSIQSFKWKPATCAKTHKLRNSKKHFKQSPIRLQKADAPSFSSKQSSHQTKRNNKSYLQLGSSSNRYAPRLPQQEQNHLQNSFLRRAQFWVRKTFSKPASLKRASLVALPAAISHKASLKPKRCASATLIQKTSKNELKHGPKNGTAWRSQPHALLREQKKSTFNFWDRLAVPKMNRKIAKSTAGRPVQRTKKTTAFS